VNIKSVAPAGNQTRKRPFVGRPRCRWQNDVMTDVDTELGSGWGSGGEGGAVSTVMIVRVT
jgi:hypothetical protein